MKKQILIAAFVSALPITVLAASHVPSLEASVNALSAEDRQSFEQNAEALTAFDGVVAEAVDRAQVSAALEQGLITEEEAADLGTALSIIEENADKFDFDVGLYMTQAIASGEISAEQAANTLEAFNSLSDDAKALVGQEGFAAEAGNAQYDALSDADKAIVDSVGD